jgi:hypothetical protein
MFSSPGAFIQWFLAQASTFRASSSVKKRVFGEEFRYMPALGVDVILKWNISLL